MKINFYYVDREYVEYLKNYEIKHRGFTCVPNIQYANRDKFVCGIVLEIENIQYYVPVSSKIKDKQNDMLIYDKKHQAKGSLRFSFMIPVRKCCLNELIIDDITDENRKILTSKELAFCRRNRDKIIKKANLTYQRVVSQVSDDVVKNSCDFKLLEKAYREYCETFGIE